MSTPYLSAQRGGMLCLMLLFFASVACQDEVQKRAVSDPCAHNTDCLDDVCHQGICGSSSPLVNGAACSSGGECRSFLCHNGRCAQGKLGDGQDCRNQEECINGACAGGLCGRAADGGLDRGPDRDLDRGPDRGGADISAAPDRGPRDHGADGGSQYESWTERALPTGFTLGGLAAQGKVLLIGGIDTKTSGQIFRSTDGGATWKGVHNTKTKVSAVALEGTLAVAVEQSGELHSSDNGGLSFTQVTNYGSGKAPCWSSDIGGIALYGGNVLAAGKKSLCWASNPAGPYTKEDVTQLNPNAEVDAAALGRHKGKVIGLATGYTKGKNYVLRSASLGGAWSDHSAAFSGVQGQLNGLYMDGAGLALAVDKTGGFHRSTDGGLIWSHGSVGGGAKTIGGVAHEKLAGGAGTVIVSGLSTHLSVNNGGFFAAPKGLSAPTGLRDRVAFDGAGKAYLGQRNSSGGDVVLVSSW